MTLSKLRLPELAASALISWLILLAALAPAIVADFDHIGRASLVEQGGTAGIQSGSTPASSRS